MNRSRHLTWQAAPVLAALATASMAAGALAALGLGPSAHAQVIKRGSAPAEASDDDDILAPAKTDRPAPTEKKPAETTEPTEELPAGADEKPASGKKALSVGVLALVPVGETGKPLADDVTKAVTKELSESAIFSAVPLVLGSTRASAAPIDEEAARAALTQAKQALSAGTRFLSDAAPNPGKARKAMQLALADLEKAAPLLTDVGELVAAELGLAEAAAREGKEDEEDAHLRAAAAFNPEHEIEGKVPLFIRAYGRARTRLLKDDRGIILIDDTAAGATIEIDGRPAGTAPVRITSLPAGRHLVRALRDGLPAWGTVVEVTGKQETKVSPGFLVKDGKDPSDELAQNKLSAGAVAAVAEAAKAAGHAAAVVGVVERLGGQLRVGLVLVDAGGAGAVALPLASIQADLLDIGIEVLKPREKADEVLGGERGLYATKGSTEILEGARAGTAAKVALVEMRYDVKLQKEPERSRVVGATKPDPETGDSDSDEDGRVLSTGKRGGGLRLDDEDDPYATGGQNNARPKVEDPDAPLTEQAWFWPAVVGGGAAGVVLVGGGTVAALVGLGVLPDPRPAAGGEVHFTLP